MQPTGRRFSSPTGELFELEDDGHAIYTGVLFQERYRELDGVKGSVAYGRNFLEEPMVFGVCALAEDDVEAGSFLYRTGTAWSLAEILAGARARKEYLGPRAAAELAWLGGLVLSEAGESGEMQGVFCHGDVSPWRILIRPEGDLLIIGYGLPEVEWLRMRRTGDETPLNDAFAYAPPERPAGSPEDSRSDLYSLAICVAETCTGERLYDGPPADAFNAARAGVARGRIGQIPTKVMPRAMRDLLVDMTAVDPGARPDLAVWAAAWEDIAGTMKGPGLIDVAQRHAAEAHKLAAHRAKPLANVDSTRSHKLSDLRTLAAPSKPGRVGRATRGGGTRTQTPIVVAPAEPPAKKRSKRPTTPAGMEPVGEKARPSKPAEPPTVTEPTKAKRPSAPAASPEVSAPKRAKGARPSPPKDSAKRPSKPSEPPSEPTRKRPEPPAEKAERKRSKGESKRPSKPKRPAEPAADDAPKRPSKPKRPAEPAAEDTPKRPSKPKRPAEPAADDTPKRPSKPKRPAEPAAEDTPKRPSKPKRPAEPAAEDTPKRPSKPKRPSPPSDETPRKPSRPSEPEGTPRRPSPPADTPERPQPPADVTTAMRRPSAPEEPEDDATAATPRPSKPKRGRPKRPARPGSGKKPRRG